MTDDQLCDFKAKIANDIVSKLNAARQENAVTNAIELLLGRIVAAGNSLRVLNDNAPHDIAFDGAMILRGIYDAMLQALYILKDPQHQNTRAEDYLDFFWIEKRNMQKRAVCSSTAFGKQMATSKLRAVAEPATEHEYNRVYTKFKNMKGPKTRDHWYKGSLRDLAKEVGLESEYELLQEQLSGAVHASAFALKAQRVIHGNVLMTFAWKFSFRVLGLFAKYAK
jgi:hypothetical protein